MICSCIVLLEYLVRRENSSQDVTQHKLRIGIGLTQIIFFLIRIITMKYDRIENITAVGTYSSGVIIVTRNVTRPQGI